MPAKKDTLDIYQDKRGEWRWRRKSPDGSLIGAACEGYKDKADCEKNANRPKTAKDKWEVYEDKRGEYRWRRKASNGQVVGASSEGYKKKSDAEANAARQGYTG